MAGFGRIGRDEKEQLSDCNQAKGLRSLAPTPYKTITSILKSLTLDFSRYCISVVSKKETVIFNKLPPMQFLWLLHYHFKMLFGYKFLEQAISTTAWDIGSDPSLSDEEKGYSLLFLNTTFNQIGGSENFDFILKANLHHIPLCVQLGMHHEGDRFKHKDLIFKKFDKRLKKIMQEPHQRNSIIDQYYKKTIK